MAEVTKGQHELIQNLVRNIINCLVDRPDDVKISLFYGTATTTVEIQVADSDYGKVKGKSGHIVNAIRTIVNAATRKHGRGASVELVDSKSERTIWDDEGKAV